MIQRFKMLLIFLLVSISVHSQIEKEQDSLSLFQKVDTLFIDYDLSNYSLRIFSNYKVKQFRVFNDDYRLRYIPNNRFGVGFGVANSKLLIDIAFNIKSKNKIATNRFDAQGSLIMGKHHYVSFYLQTYKGFNIKNNFNEPSIFREDIRSSTVGFNYLYTFSEIEFSYALLKAGLPNREKKVHISGGVGTFAFFDSFKSDGIVLSENGEPYFNNEAAIEKYSGRAVGILGGFLSQFVITERLIATCNIMPGIALMNKNVQLEDGSYRPSNPMLYKLDFSVALAYNVKRFYINLIYGTGIYSTNLDFDNKYLFNLSMGKFAIGYKLKVKK